MADREYRVIYKAVADFADLIKQSKLAEDKLRAMSDAQQVDRKSLRDLDAYTDAVEDVGKAAADAGDSLDDLRDSQRGAAKSSRATTREMEDQAKALTDAARSQKEYQQAVQRANRTGAQSIRMLAQQKRAQAQMRAGLEAMPRVWGREAEAAREASRDTDTHTNKVLSLATAMRHLTADTFAFRTEQRQVKVDVDRSTTAVSKMQTVMSVFGSLTRKTGSELRETTQNLDRFKLKSKESEGAVKKLGQGLRDLGSIFKGLGLPSIIMYASGTIVSGVYALGGAVVVLAQSLAQLGPLLATVPGGILAIGQAALGTKVAVKGVAEALKLWQSEQKDVQPQTYAEALKEMGPATRKFTKELVGMQGAWKKVQKATSEAFFGQFVDDLDRAKTLLPTVRKLLTTGAESMGLFADKAIKMLSSDRWQRSLSALSDSGAKVMGSLGDAVLFVAEGFRKIAMAARPLTEWLGKEFRSMSKDFSDWTDHLNAGSFTNAATRFSQFVAIIKNLGSVISSTFKAAGDTTDWFMGRFVEMSNRWAETTRKAAQDGGGRLKEFFDGLRPVMSETARLFGDLFRGLNKVVDTESLARIVKILREKMVPAILTVIESWGNTQAAERWVTLLAEAGELFAKLSDAGFFNTLINLVGAFGSLLGAINNLLDNPLIGWVFKATGAFVSLAGPILFVGKALKVLSWGLGLVIPGMTAMGGASAALAGKLGVLRAALAGAGSGWGALAVAAGALVLKALDLARNAMSANVLTADEMTAAFRRTGQALADQTTTTSLPWWADFTRVSKTTASLRDLAKYADRSLWDTFKDAFSPGGKTISEQLGLTDTFNKQLEQFTIGVQDLMRTDPEAAAAQVQTLKNALTSAGWSPERIEQVIGPLEDMTRASDEAADSIDDQAAALDRLNAKYDEYDKNIAADEARIRYKQQTEETTATIARNGKTLDLNTKKGKENYQALIDQARSNRDYRKALEETGASTDTLNTLTKKQWREFKKNAEAAGATKEEVRKLGEEYGLIPKTVKTDYKESGYQDAWDKAHQLWNYLQNQEWVVDVVFRATGKEPPNLEYNPDTGRFEHRGGPKHAAGGWIRGPGTATSDSIPAWLSDREYVVRAAAVDKYGVDFFNALNAMKLSDGGIVGLAKGGGPGKKGKIKGKFSATAKNMVATPDEVKEAIRSRRDEFRSAKEAALDNPRQLRDAREALRQALQDLADATDVEAQQIRKDQAAQDVREAQEELADALYDYQNGVSVKAAELERDQAWADWQSALEDKTNRISVGAAELEQAQAVEDYNDALEDAAKGISVGAAKVDLAQAEETYRQALFDASTGLSVRGAQADVASAEEAYRKVMASATSSQAEKLQARQALEEARAGVTNKQMEVELALAEAEQGRLEAQDKLGDTEAQVALRVMETAQRKKEADQNVVETTREVELRVRETAQAYEAAKYNVGIVTREVADRVADAQLGVTEAVRARDLLPAQIAEEIRSAQYGVEDARYSLRDTKRQNKADAKAWEEQLSKYGKRDYTRAFNPDVFKQYKKSLGKGEKPTAKGYGKWYKKHGPLQTDKSGNVGVFNTGVAREEAWNEWRDQQREDKQTFDSVNKDLEGSGAISERSEALISWFENREGHYVGADTCLANVHEALDKVGAQWGIRATDLASYSKRADIVRDALDERGLLRTGTPPRGAILLWTDRNHIAVADGRGNAWNNWDGDRIEKTPLSSMGSYKWVMPAALWTGNQRRVGGTVKAGQEYMVGESGRELFVPDVNGRILTAAQTAQLLAATSGRASFGVSMGLPGLSPNLPAVSIPSSSAAVVAAGSPVASRFGDINIYNPIPERASDSIQKRVKVLTNREA